MLDGARLHQTPHTRLGAEEGDDIEDDFTITQDAGIAEVLWRPGSVIGPAELDVLANTVTHAPRWQSRPLLIHLDLIRHITPAARQMLVAYRHEGPIALTGSDPVDRVLAAFIAQSRSRTRYFARTEDARAWLVSLRDGGATASGLQGPLLHGECPDLVTASSRP